MNFLEHTHLRGQHSFLSASKYHWTNYSDEKLATVYSNYKATLRGTQLHDLAEQLIRLNVRLPDIESALNMFVNDAIGYRMRPEQPLFYSTNAFGTADAISYRQNELRIHDLKTGKTKVNMRQLEIYAALFCLEYKTEPSTLTLIELRVYQGGEIIVHHPEPEDIKEIMNTIVSFDSIIKSIDQQSE